MMSHAFFIPRQLRRSLLVALLLLMSAAGASAQSTTFTYQGRLQDGGTPANGTYDLQLTLWDAASGGIQQPQPSPVTVTRTSVLVTGGIFSVQLDFGANAFPGADRFLEIGVRPAGGGSFTILSPRQQTTATPYAIRSANATTADSATTATNATNAATATNATQLGGVAASQYVLTGDARLSDSRTPTAGSPNYVQNTTSPQASSNFNISGNGTAGGALSANAVNAATQYNIGGNRVLIAPGSSNLFVGVGTGASNTLGAGNSFFGTNAGNNNSTGFANSFFGGTAGLHNTTGQRNSFFGSSAGFGNLVAGSTGSDNSFFGNAAGLANSTGFNNSFFGSQAGQNNQTGSENAFFGYLAGFNNTTGIRNAFFGTNAGGSNRLATDNAYFGVNAGLSGDGAGNAFFGSSAGRASAGSADAFFGADAGFLNTTGSGNTFVGASAGLSNTIEDNNTFIGFRATGATGISNSTAIGANALVTQSASLVLGNGAKVGIGTSAPLARLDVRGDVFVGLTTQPDTASGDNLYLGNTNGQINNSFRLDGFADNLYIVAHSGPSSFAGAGIVFRTSTAAGGETDRMSIADNGNVVMNNNLTVNGTFSNPSDARLKRNVQALRYGLSEVLRLKPVTWQWKNNPAGGTQLGMVAQEVEPLIPELVIHDPDPSKPLTMNYIGFLPIIVRAVQQQQEQIKEQQKEIETLRVQNTVLNARLRAVEKNLRKRVGSARRRRQVP